jgi:hypothetical protein
VSNNNNRAAFRRQKSLECKWEKGAGTRDLIICLSADTPLRAQGPEVPALPYIPHHHRHKTHIWKLVVKSVHVALLLFKVTIALSGANV